mmetsp:Transcript_5352/g.13453  ORF Transcript_5352/g.13453 Transcript_5352/m.13453 type:complete len:242 (+) Transcript_5352:2-727(+)
MLLSGKNDDTPGQSCLVGGAGGRVLWPIAIAACLCHTVIFAVSVFLLVTCRFTGFVHVAVRKFFFEEKFTAGFWGLNGSFFSNTMYMDLRKNALIKNNVSASDIKLVTTFGWLTFGLLLVIAVLQVGCLAICLLSRARQWRPKAVCALCAFLSLCFSALFCAGPVTLAKIIQRVFHHIDGASVSSSYLFGFYMVWALAILSFLAALLYVALFFASWRLLPHFEIVSTEAYRELDRLSPAPT